MATTPDDRAPRERNIGCLGAILRLFTGAHGRPADEQFPYAVSTKFLSKAEMAFTRVLLGAVDRERYLVCPKVNVGDILWVTDRERFRVYRNKIGRKHVDFLLLDVDALRPRLAIELDDASHERSNRRDRDAFLDSALAAAGLPILHVKAKQTYDAGELSRRIEQLLQPQRGSPPSRAPR